MFDEHLAAAWAEQQTLITITGATGVGKTFVACALAQHALRRRYRAIYRRASRLFDRLVQHLQRPDPLPGPRQVWPRLWSLSPVREQTTRPRLGFEVLLGDCDLAEGRAA